MMHPITMACAAARLFKTHHNALDIDLYMRIAPELFLKRLVVGGFDQVLRDQSQFSQRGMSRLHGPEFTMLEFYQAGVRDLHTDLIDLTEAMVGELAREVSAARG